MKEGKLINVPAGVGWGDHPTQSTHEFEDEAQVRVQIWNNPYSPTKSTPWTHRGRGSSVMTHCSAGSSGCKVPERVKVVMRIEAECSDEQNVAVNNKHIEFTSDPGYNGGSYYFDATGSAQGTDDCRQRLYGGLVYRFNQHYVETFCPEASSQSVSGAGFFGNIMTIGDGWGIGTGKMGYHYESSMKVKTMVWKYNELAERDAAYISVDVTDANEAPVPKVYHSAIMEDTNKGQPICDALCSNELNSRYKNGRVEARDPDLDSSKAGTLQYEIISGNTGGALRITSAGLLEIENRSYVNFETQPFFSIGVKVTDAGGASSLGTVALTTTDRNDLPRFCESECTNGQCNPKRPGTHQPLLWDKVDSNGNPKPTIVRKISEFGKVGQYALQGECVDAPKQLPTPQSSKSCGPICGMDDDMFTTAQSIYFKLESGTSTMGLKQTQQYDPLAVWRVNFCSGLVMMAQAGKIDFEGIDAPTYYDLLV